jgi:hypothetical protein
LFPEEAGDEGEGDLLLGLFKALRRGIFSARLLVIPSEIDIGILLDDTGAVREKEGDEVETVGMALGWEKTESGAFGMLKVPARTLAEVKDD